MKIFLIGMPGSGKTHLGKELAERLLIDFVDLDAEIEKAEQKLISEIFKQEGEVYFRTLEARLLREWATSPKAFVMATGGGAPCFHGGMEVINANGVSVYLDLSVDVLVERVRHNQDRPLLLTTDEMELRQKLERMRSSRLACYRQAQIIVENPDVNSVLDALRPRM